MSNFFSVLIVDDSFLMRATIKKIIQSYVRITEIAEAHNGAEALEMVKHNNYDVILLDIEMPVMDGIEFLKRGRLHTNAAVVIISSLAKINSVEVEKALHFGATDIVAKPTGVQSLGMEEEKSQEILSILHRIYNSRNQ